MVWPSLPSSLQHLLPHELEVETSKILKIRICTLTYALLTWLGQETFGRPSITNSQQNARPMPCLAVQSGTVSGLAQSDLAHFAFLTHILAHTTHATSRTELPLAAKVPALLSCQPHLQHYNLYEAHLRLLGYTNGPAYRVYVILAAHRGSTSYPDS